MTKLQPVQTGILINVVPDNVGIYFGRELAKSTQEAQGLILKPNMVLCACDPNTQEWRNDQFKVTLKYRTSSRVACLS